MTVRELLKSWKKQAKEMGILDREINTCTGRAQILLFLPEGEGFYDTPVTFKYFDEEITFVKCKGTTDIYIDPKKVRRKLD